MFQAKPFSSAGKHTQFSSHESTNASASQQKTRTCCVQAPTRIDLAGGTLDIWPLVPILQEKTELWNKPVATVNIAIDLLATAMVTLVSTDAGSSSQTQNLSKYSNTHLLQEQSQNSQSLNWMFEDLTIADHTQRTAFGNLLNSDQAKLFPLARGVVRCYLPKLNANKITEIRVSTNAQAPKGSGLGGSSSVVIAILKALNTLLNIEQENDQLCEVAKNVEAGILGGLAGNQDHFAAAIGGVQAVRHSVFGSTSQKIQCNGADLMQHLVLAHSGQEHFSAFNNWLILEKVLTGDKNILHKFAEIALIAEEIIPQLEKSAWQNLAKSITQEWEIRRTLAPGVTTETLDSLYRSSIKAGAIGGKVCGAGGGGVLVMVLPEPGARSKVTQAINQAGGKIIETSFAASGARVI